MIIMANKFAYFYSVNQEATKIKSPDIMRLIIIQVFRFPYWTKEYFYNRGAKSKSNYLLKT